MDGIRDYLISVTAVAIICAVAKCFTGFGQFSDAMIKLVAGVIMAVAVISPLVKLNPGELPALSEDVVSQAQAAAQTGQLLAEEETISIISQRMRSYILDKAEAYGASLTVEIRFSQENSLLPEHVILKGRISPYAKAQLQRAITDDMGIAKENQTWIG